MRIHKNNNSSGFALLEVLVVVAVIGVLASLAVPNYLSYRERARAIQCALNRYHIDQAEYDYFIQNNKPGMQIDASRGCPSGGIHAWLVSDPAAPGYPKVGCSIHFWTNPPSSRENLLYSSDFDSMDGLTILNGPWEIKNGNLVKEKTGKGDLVFGNKAWTDYELGINATLSSKSSYGVYYRADGEKQISGYLLQFNPANMNFIVKTATNGNLSSAIASFKMPKDFPTYNQSHELTISLQGDHHIIKVDGETVMEFDDNTYPSGMAGVSASQQSQVSFENASVRETG